MIPETDIDKSKKLEIGKQYVVWDMFRRRIVWGYYVANDKTMVSKIYQSFATPIYHQAYVFFQGGDISKKSLKNILKWYGIEKVSIEGIKILHCLTDNPLPVKEFLEPLWD